MAKGSFHALRGDIDIYAGLSTNTRHPRTLRV